MRRAILLVTSSVVKPPPFDLRTLPERIAPLRIAAFTATSAAGIGNAALLASLRARASGLAPNDFTTTPLLTWIGRVAQLESLADSLTFPAEHARWDCSNNRLAWLALQQDGFLDAARGAIARRGAARVAVLLGTSTSSIAASEDAYAHLSDAGRFPEHLRRAEVHSLHSTATFVQRCLGAAGPCATVSTACSSSAKVFAQAARMLRTGVVDAAIVGGVDTLAGSTLSGFHALGLVSPTPCRPFDVARDGISIGEAGGFALLERDVVLSKRRDLGDERFAPLLIGYGESSDAHHMSAPHPDGAGARFAIDAALARAGMTAADVDYINLHGTATQKNDAIEARVVADLFPPSTRASATKGWTGHTLGAAGIVEAVVTLLALREGFVPGTLNTGRLSAECGPQLRIANETAELRVALSNAFAFGGNNCVLAFARNASASMRSRAVS